MRFNILKAKRPNLLVYTLMALQLVILVGIGIVLVSAVSDVGLITIASTTITFFIGLPMLILLYASSADKTLKTIFFGLTADILLLSISGIVWYILSTALCLGWLVPIAKVIMVSGYVPFIYALFAVYTAEHKRLDRNAKIFIGFVNVSCSLALLFFALTHLSTGNPFDIAIYTLSMLGDIIILALAAMLIVIYSSITLRYIFSIAFCFTLMSLAGDALNFIDAIRVTAYDFAAYSSYFYDSMLLFLVIALLVYSIYREFSMTTVEEVNKKLDDTRQAMHDLIMQMPDAACILDQDGGVLMVNDQFLKLFGVDRQGAMKKFNLFQHAEVLKCEMYDKLPLVKNGGTITIDRTKVLFPGDRSAYLSIKMFPTVSFDGAISSYISIIEDVTARVQAEEELKHAKALVELYIDLMSHDINNMNQVGIGYLEIALDTLGIQEDKKSLLAKPMEALGNSSRLIENVKKLRRASEGNMYMRPVDMGKVLKGVIAEYGQAPGREVTIEYDIAENAIVNANELLKDVFVNLVSNSIKHSSRAVWIHVKQETIENDGKKYYRVIVEDNGPGIPDEIKPLIFDRLLRGRSRNGSSGLGLYLVKALIDNYGGFIAVEDRVPGDPRKGARFIVTLPAA